MKTARELVHYTYIDDNAMWEWDNREIEYAETILGRWAKECRLKEKREDDLVSDIAVYDLDGDVTTHNYMVALLRCNEKYNMEIVYEAVDFILKEMAGQLTNYMHKLYPCLRRTHYVVMRANQKGQCVLYVGPFGKEESPTAFQLFGDGGVFMTKGLEACLPHVREIGFFV